MISYYLQQWTSFGIYDDNPFVFTVEDNIVLILQKCISRLQTVYPLVRMCDILMELRGNVLFLN